MIHAFLGWSARGIAVSLLALVSPLVVSPASGQTTSDPQPAKATLAIVGGYLIDGHESPPVRNSVVLINGSQIVAVGTTDSLRVPSTAKVIDASGLTVLPGLVDSHVHIDTLGMADYVRFHNKYGFPPGYDDTKDLSKFRTRYEETMAVGARQALMAGVTTIHELGGYPEALKATRSKIDRGQIPGPRIRASMGWMINQPPEAFKRHFSGGRQRYNTNVHTVEEARAAALKAIGDGATVIKQMGGLTADQVKAITEEAHSRGMKVTGHVGGTADLLMYVRNGLDGIEHGGGIDLEDPEVVRELRARRVTVVPTTVQALAAILATTEEPGWVDNRRVRATMPAEMWADVRDTIRLPLLARNPYFQGEIRPRRIEDLGRHVKRLYDLGIRMVAASDAASQANLRVDALWRQMELLVRFGIPPIEVISMATRKGAEWVGIGDKVGTIEPGKLADIIVVDGNPLTHMRDLRNVLIVIKDGVEYNGIGTVVPVNGTVGTSTTTSR